MGQAVSIIAGEHSIEENHVIRVTWSCNVLCKFRVELRATKNGNPYPEGSFIINNQSARELSNFFMDAGVKYCVVVTPVNDKGENYAGEKTVSETVFEREMAPSIRHISSAQEDLDNLLNQIRAYKPRYGDRLNVARTNVLVMSSTGQGKSSYINSIVSLLADSWIERCAALQNQSGTVTLNMDHVDVKIAANMKGNAPKFAFWDMWGYDLNKTDNDVVLNHVEYIVDGKVPDKFQQPNGMLSDTNPALHHSPTVGERAHVVALVASPTNLYDGHFVEFFQKIRDRIAPRAAFVIVLSKVDTLQRDSRFDEVHRAPLIGHPERVFEFGQSDAILRLASREGGKQVDEIVPVVNLVGKRPSEAPLGQRVLLARALKTMLDRADDHFSRLVPAHTHSQSVHLQPVLTTTQSTLTKTPEQATPSAALPATAVASESSSGTVSPSTRILRKTRADNSS